MKGDNDSLESALAIAIAKKMFGMSNFKKMVNAPEIARKINEEGEKELKNLEKQTKRTKKKIYVPTLDTTKVEGSSLRHWLRGFKI